MKSFILDHWKAFGAGLLVLIVAGLLAWQDHKIKTLKEERDTARASLASYQAALTDLQADTAAKIGALEAESGRQTDRVRNLERLLGQIEGASNEKDGIVAPVLRDAIDGLYGTNAASEGNKARSPTKPSVLR
ncbi:MAG: hypothetical protein AB7H77_01160 [Bdellovibrionales bacterium]